MSRGARSAGILRICVVPPTGCLKSGTRAGGQVPHETLRVFALFRRPEAGVRRLRTQLPRAQTW